MQSSLSPPKKAPLDLADVRACATSPCLSELLSLPGRSVGCRLCTQREKHTPFTTQRPIFLSPTTTAIALYLHLHVHLRLLLAYRCGHKQILATHTHTHTHAGEVSLGTGCAQTSRLKYKSGCVFQ